MEKDSTLDEVRAVLAHKSWDGQKWVEDAESRTGGQQGVANAV
jgi:hypothetical protein